MGAIARLGPAGQLIVPEMIRRALGAEEGNQLLFRVRGDRALVSRIPDFLSLAGSVAVPDERAGVAWPDIVRHVREMRTAARLR